MKRKRQKLSPMEIKFSPADIRQVVSGAEYHRFERKLLSRNLRLTRKAKPKVRETQAGNRLLQNTLAAEKLTRKTAAEMRKWRVKLHPYMEPLPLMPLYELKKIGVPAEIQLWTKTRFDFYVLQFGAALRVIGGGYRIRRLVVKLNFDLPHRKGVRHVTAYSIFPTTEYKTYGGIDLLVGIGADLGFEVPLDKLGNPIVNTSRIDGQVKAKLVFGPFHFPFEKRRIMGEGQGTSEVFWEVTAGEHLRGGSFKTSMVLMAPKNKKVMKVEGRLEVDVQGRAPWDKKTLYDRQEYKVEL